MSTNLRSHLKESLKQEAIYSGISILLDDEEASGAQAISLHSRRPERSKKAKTEKVKYFVQESCIQSLELGLIFELQIAVSCSFPAFFEGDACGRGGGGCCGCG
jgi:hypothetical protein